MKQYYSFLLLFLLSEQLFTQTGQPCPGIPTIDYGGKTYHTVQINNQCWLKENLNIGTMINGSIGQSNNGIIEKYCYNNDSLNCEIYGGYYQLNEALHYVNLNGTQGICPTGWHVPTRSELGEVEDALNGDSNAMKAIGQGTGSGAGTNTSGFSLLIAGQYNPYTQIVEDVNKMAYLWTSSEYDTDYFLTLLIYAQVPFFNDIHYYVTYGNSVRCLNNLSVSALPVELTSFTAAVQDASVLLVWRTASEINSAVFVVETRSADSEVWCVVGNIPAAGNSFNAKEYSYLDNSKPSGMYYYRLKMVDLDGTFNYSSNVQVVILSPKQFALCQNFPNPFNGTTTFTYQIPETENVTLKIFTINGELVRVLVDKTQCAGTYSVVLHADDLGTAEYFYQLRAGMFLETKKFILLK